MPRLVTHWLVPVLAVAIAACLAPACTTRPIDAHPAGPSVVTVGIIDTGIGAGSLEPVVDRLASTSLVPGEDLADVDGHGTEMAWIVHHAAPGARLVVAKAVDRYGSTTDERLAAAVEHLRGAGATVVLVSLSGAAPLPRTHEAFVTAGRAGVLIVAAAGNDGLDLDRGSSYPGGYRLPNLVTVAAADASGDLLGSSNRGGPTSVIAPGAVPTCTLDGRPTTSVGTSAAAALVAGTAAARSGAASMPERIARLRAHFAAAASGAGPRIELASFRSCAA